MGAKTEIVIAREIEDARGVERADLTVQAPGIALGGSGRQTSEEVTHGANPRKWAPNQRCRLVGSAQWVRFLGRPHRASIRGRDLDAGRRAGCVRTGDRFGRGLPAMMRRPAELGIRCATSSTRVWHEGGRGWVWRIGPPAKRSGPVRVTLSLRRQ